MTEPGPDDVAARFEEHRGRLESVAYRMLGSAADAQDAVQEAWLRLAGQDADAIDNLAGWLTAVVGRICIDMLRSRKSRPEAAYDLPLPEIVVTDDTTGAPEEDALLGDSVGLALFVVLETLTPTERLAFVLHDVFAVPFDEIGQIVGKSTDAAKMLASRARRKVQGARPTVESRRPRAVVDAFIAAARRGDFQALLELLDPDVVWRGHSPHGIVVRLGATDVAGRVQNASRAKATSRPVLVNGEPGIVAYAPNGRPMSVMACTVVDGRIVGIMSVTDPAVLDSIDLPGRPV